MITFVTVVIVVIIIIIFIFIIFIIIFIIIVVVVVVVIIIIVINYLGGGVHEGGLGTAEEIRGLAVRAANAKFSPDAVLRVKRKARTLLEGTLDRVASRLKAKGGASLLHNQKVKY